MSGVWHQLSMTLEASQADRLSEYLSQLGALSVSLKDAEDHAIFEPPIDTQPLWPKVVLQALFEAHQPHSEVEHQILKILSTEAQIHWSIIHAQEWRISGRENFCSKRCGERLWICPSWTDQPNDPNAVIVTLDPGVAFGTGAHATTDMCLNWLDRHLQGGEVVLDFGSGSGILSIAALKLGAQHVDAVDIDPQARQSTWDNAQLNQVEQQLTLTSLDNLRTEKFDLVVANILANTLIELAPTIQRILKPSGKLVLSGILLQQEPQLIEVYQAKFRLTRYSQQEGWVCLSN
jgi:ribosomal protein L11 methyltransferase